MEVPERSTPRRLDTNQANTAPDETARALVLHDRPLVVDLIQLTLNHGLFVVRAAGSISEAETILAEWHPDLAVIDMDHEDSTALLTRIGASNGHTRRESPVLGLTKWGDLSRSSKHSTWGSTTSCRCPSLRGAPRQSDRHHTSGDG